MWYSLIHIMSDLDSSTTLFNFIHRSSQKSFIFPTSIYSLCQWRTGHATIYTKLLSDLELLPVSMMGCISLQHFLLSSHQSPPQYEFATRSQPQPSSSQYIHHRNLPNLPSQGHGSIYGSNLVPSSPFTRYLSNIRRRTSQKAATAMVV